MNMNKLIEKFKQYHFEFRHLTVLFVILFAFQLIVSFINKASIKNFIGNTQSWYQKDSAEEIANITATSLELLLETINPKTKPGSEEAARIIQSEPAALQLRYLQTMVEMSGEKNSTIIPITLDILGALNGARKFDSSVNNPK